MDATTLLRPSDPDAAVAGPTPPPPVNVKGASLQLMIVGVTDFDSSELMMATDALNAATQFDVATSDVELSVTDLVEFVSLTQPDAVVLDWSWGRAAAFAQALFADEKARSIPVMILSADGESSPERFRCGVWEDIAPNGFDDVVSLIGAYLDRTAFRRCVAALRVIDLFERLLSASPASAVAG